MFNSAKCYFIVCVKGTKVAIYLWRGKDQTLIDWETSFELFLDTKFRNVSNAQRDRTNASRAASQISNTGIMGGKGSLDALGGHKDKDLSEEWHALKSTFKPINQSQAISDTIMLQKERVSNLNPVKISEVAHEINLRSIVVMDNEPQHFL